jgi:hypothetical protein
MFSSDRSKRCCENHQPVRYDEADTQYPHGIENNVEGYTVPPDNDHLIDKLMTKYRNYAHRSRRDGWGVNEDPDDV